MTGSKRCGIFAATAAAREQQLKSPRNTHVVVVRDRVAFIHMYYIVKRAKRAWLAARKSGRVKSDVKAPRGAHVKREQEDRNKKTHQRERLDEAQLREAQITISLHPLPRQQQLFIIPLSLSLPLGV